MPNLPLQFTKKQQGITYIEIILVVIILGIIAAVAMPDLSSTDPVKLDLAAQEFANAMRFARSESIRKGKPYGFEQNNELIDVRRVDTSSSPWSFINDVYHPVNKKLYNIDLKDFQSTRGITVTRNTTYRGNCTYFRRVYFDSHGTPWCLVPENVGLIEFENVLTLGSHSRTVKLHTITGRVTIQ